MSLGLETGLGDNKNIIPLKDVALIKICGDALIIRVNSLCDFIPPTEEQRKNLKEMLCIDVEILEE